MKYEKKRVKDCNRANTEPVNVRKVGRAFSLIQLMLNRADLKYKL